MVTVGVHFELHSVHHFGIIGGSRRSHDCVQDEADAESLGTDLAPGAWQVWRNGKVFAPAVQVASEAGVLCLEAPAGTFCLRR